MKKKLIVLQEGNKDCGAASLLSVIRYYGGDISLDRLIELTKTNKEGTIAYKAYYDEAKEKVSVRFQKVTGHSGDKYNDYADKLAKQALGLA